jgi:hypothetical protein
MEKAVGLSPLSGKFLPIIKATTLPLRDELTVGYLKGVALFSVLRPFEAVHPVDKQETGAHLN